MGVGPRQPMTLAQRQHIVRTMAIYDAMSPAFRQEVLAVPAPLQDDAQMHARWRQRTLELLQGVTLAQVTAGEALRQSPEGAELERQLSRLYQALALLRQPEDLRAGLDVQICA